MFTLGCVAWVVNGHYALYSVGGAAAQNEEQALNVVAIAALFGGKGKWGGSPWDDGLGCVAWVVNGHYALYNVGGAVA